MSGSSPDPTGGTPPSQGPQGQEVKGGVWLWTLDPPSGTWVHSCLLSQYNQLGWWHLYSLSCLTIVYMVTAPVCHWISEWCLATPQRGWRRPLLSQGWWVMDRIGPLLSDYHLMRGAGPVSICVTAGCCCQLFWTGHSGEGAGLLWTGKTACEVNVTNIVSVFYCRVISEHEPPMLSLAAGHLSGSFYKRDASPSLHLHTPPGCLNRGHTAGRIRTKASTGRLVFWQ